MVKCKILSYTHELGLQFSTFVAIPYICSRVEEQCAGQLGEGLPLNWPRPLNLHGPTSHQHHLTPFQHFWHQNNHFHFCQLFGGFFQGSLLNWPRPLNLHGPTSHQHHLTPFQHFWHQNNHFHFCLSTFLGAFLGLSPNNQPHPLNLLGPNLPLAPPNNHSFSTFLAPQLALSNFHFSQFLRACALIGHPCFHFLLSTF